MILHIGAYSSKHILFPFIDFINEEFDQKEHCHVLCAKESIKLEYPNARTLDIFTQPEELLTYMNQADKIFLHGIWYDKICEIIYFHKHLLSKVFWILWGGEYAFNEKVSNIKRWLFKEIPYLITGSKDDYKFVKRTYDTQGEYLPCTVIYPNNLYQISKKKIQKSTSTRVLIGNSADPTNNHFAIFKKLSKLDLHNIELLIPLVYGDTEYSNSVEKEAVAIFENRVKFIKEYMNFEDYISFLATIDIAIFNHKIQQAAGNTIALLGFGCKVYINSLSNLNNYFQQYDVKLYDNQEINLDLIDPTTKHLNQTNMKKHFSKEILVSVLKNIFAKKISDE